MIVHERAFPVTAQISWYAEPATVSLASKEGQTVFQVSLDHWRGEAEHYPDDSLRERFWSVASEIAALDFLARTTGLIFDSLDDLSPGPNMKNGHREITWTAFQAYQKLTRFIATNGFLYDEEAPISWARKNMPDDIQSIMDNAPLGVQDLLTGKPTSFIELDAPSTSQKVRLSILTHTALEAIIAGLWVDRLAGDSFRQCRFKGCEVVYNMKGQRADKFYCTTDHARHASIRRSRENKKAVKNGK